VLKYVGRRLINYVVLLFIAVSFAYLLASYALDPRNAFDQTNPKLNWTAINQSLTNYNINPDMGAVRAMGEDGLPPLELGLDPTW